MYYHSSVIKALKEQIRYQDNLLTRTREILKKEEVKFPKQNLTNTLKDLVKFKIISKEKDGYKMFYSLQDDKHAKEGIELIEAVSEGSRTVNQNQWLVDNYRKQFQESKIRMKKTKKNFMKKSLEVLLI